MKKPTGVISKPGTTSSQSKVGSGNGAGDEGEDDGEEGHDQLEKFLRAPSTPTFEAYLSNRVFVYLHHFSGPKDPLGAALRRAAESRKLKIEVVSCDLTLGADLAATQPFTEQLEKARAAKFDGYHAGFPCATFTRARWRSLPGGPPPVRSKQEPYGIVGQDLVRQAEADAGTIFAARSVLMAETILNAPSPSGLDPPVSLENPPPSEHPQHLSAWELPEVEAFAEKGLRAGRLKWAAFPTCAYQEELPESDRFFKPQRFLGSILQINKLSAACSCAKSSRHKQVNLENSKASAEYPEALCSQLATFIVDHFEKMAYMEWLKVREARLAKEIARMKGELSGAEGNADELAEMARAEAEVQAHFKSQMQAAEMEEASASLGSVVRNAGPVDAEKGIKRAQEDTGHVTKDSTEEPKEAPRRRKKRRKIMANAEGEDANVVRVQNTEEINTFAGATPKGMARPTSGHGASSEARATDMDWIPGKGNFGMMATQLKKKPEFLPHLGGLRNPALATLGLPTARALGVKIIAAWESLVQRLPRALVLAETYGTKDAKEDERVTSEWRATLRRLSGSKGVDAVRLQDALKYKSPLFPDLLEAYIHKSGDPEQDVPNWVRNGAPLGMDKKIGECGIFPKAEGPQVDEDVVTAAEVIAGDKLKNYLSVVQNEGEAEIELSRYEQAGYLKRIRKKEALHKHGAGTISRLGLILKTKEDGSLKRRIVIDLKRSSGNAKATLSERLVLPRAKDAVRMTRHQRRGLEELQSKYRRHNWSTDQWGFEWVVIDISDAFMHLAVDPDELKHCMAPGLQDDEVIVFIALLFGFKTAPLFWSRVAALLGRLLQSAMDPVEAAHQTYLDDALWSLQGGLARRNVLLSFILYTMRALGFIVALSKGARGREVVWCGVTFTHTQDDTIILGVSEKFLQELASLLASWKGKGMAPTKELRQAAGKAAWLAGVLPRTRWASRMLYAALHDRIGDIASGKEELRRSTRSDTRARDHLFPIARLNRPGASLAPRAH